MPLGNPAGYSAYNSGQQQAQRDLGLTQPQQPKPVTTAGTPATQQTPRAPQMPSPTRPPSMPTPPSAALGYNAFGTMSQNAATKNAAFSMSPNPDTRALEAKRDNVRQPATNQDRKTATGIDPAFNSLATPSESDPYTIPRMF